MASTTAASRIQNGATPSANAAGDGAKRTKPHATGQKLMVRHLPPLITQEEIQAILGEEWKTGNGKVGWAEFQRGKVPKSNYKEPKPSIYTLHIVEEEDVPTFKEFVLRTVWQDAKNSYTTSTIQVHAMDISTRVPPAKHRVDPRQGTIDQDPEFQSFLHSLTQPKEAQSKEADNGEQLTSNNDEVKEKTVSHLVKYIQEKKIAKAKEAAAAKSAKHGRQDSQGGKPKAGEDSKKKGKETKADKNDKDKDKAAPKLLTKKAAAQEAAAEAAKQAAGQASATKNSEEAAPKSRRANIAQAAKILQRDLGLSPGSAHRRARQNAAKAETGPGTESVTSTTAEKQPLAVKEPETSKSVPTGPKAQANEGSRRSRGKAKATGSTAATESNKGKSNDGPTKPTTGPIILLKKEASKKEESGATAPASTQSTGNTASTAASAAPITPTGPKASGSKGASSKVGLSGQQKKGAAQTGSGALRAFVKHANPSQGITEVLLKQAMGAFGPVTFIEMDKRKGFAYVDFADTEALRKAIAASPVSIAQGTVQVLERKEKSAGDAQGTAASTSTSAAASASTSTDRPKRGNRGRGRRGGGAGANPTTITNGNNETPSSAGPATG